MRRATTHAALVLAVIVGASCGRSDTVKEAPAPAPAPPTVASAPPKPPLVHPRLAPRAPGASDAPRLPEDPAAGKRASRQWDEHLEEEERERQLVFDRDRIPAHRATIALILAARARYDRVKTEAALIAVQAAMPAQLAKIGERVAALDPWGVTSPLLTDYAALQTDLAVGYPDAKLAALRGEASALQTAQASFDARVREMREWLERASTAKGEGEKDEDGEHEEHEREERREREERERASAKR